MKVDEIELYYEDGARSVHTLLRVIDRDNPDRTEQVLFDNLRTPMVLVFLHDWEMRQETIISQELKLATPNAPVSPELLPGVTAQDLMIGWREYASGSTDETLLIEVYGDPDVLAEANS